MKKIIFISIFATICWLSGVKAQTHNKDLYPRKFTNDSITITQAELYHFLTIIVSPTSTANGTLKTLVTGGTIGGKATTTIDLYPGLSITVPFDDRWVRYIRIIAPLNCTIEVIGIKYN